MLIAGPYLGIFVLCAEVFGPGSSVSVCLTQETHLDLHVFNYGEAGHVNDGLILVRFRGGASVRLSAPRPNAFRPQKNITAVIRLHNQAFRRLWNTLYAKNDDGEQDSY